MKKISDKGYCYECDDDVEFDIKEENKKIIVKNVEVNVAVKRAICKKCGSRVTVKTIEKENEITVYDAYKSAKGLLTSKEIIAIRKQLGLSQCQFARLIAIGEKDIARYENGAIQNDSIDLLMRVAAYHIDLSTIKQTKFSSDGSIINNPKLKSTYITPIIKIKG